MTQEATTPSINQLSVKNGLILGGISAGLSIVFYIINPVLQYTSLLVLLFTVVLGIALIVVLAIDIRKKIGGFWSFGKAYVSLMIMSVVAILIGILLGFIIFKFVDPTMPGKVNDALADVTQQRLEKFGMQQDQIDVAMKPFTNGENLAKLQPTLFNEAKNFLIALIGYGIVNLIIAAIIKKKPPMFATIDADAVV